MMNLKKSVMLVMTEVVVHITTVTTQNTLTKIMLYTKTTMNVLHKTKYIH